MLRIIYSAIFCTTLFGCSSNVPAPDATNPSSIVQSNSPILDPIKVVEQSKPPYMVTGRVSVNGQPVKAMLVEAYTGDCFGGPLVAKTTTDAKGQFAFKNIKPNTYFIGVNEFRGNGKLLPGYTSTCSKGRYFSGMQNLDFQIGINKR